MCVTGRHIPTVDRSTRAPTIAVTAVVVIVSLLTNQKPRLVPTPFMMLVLLIAVDTRFEKPIVEVRLDLRSGRNGDPIRRPVADVLYSSFLLMEPYVCGHKPVVRNAQLIVASDIHGVTFDIEIEFATLQEGNVRKLALRRNRFRFRLGVLTLSVMTLRHNRRLGRHTFGGLGRLGVDGRHRMKSLLDLSLADFASSPMKETLAGMVADLISAGQGDVGDEEKNGKERKNRFHDWIDGFEIPKLNSRTHYHKNN